MKKRKTVKAKPSKRFAYKPHHSCMVTLDTGGFKAVTVYIDYPKKPYYAYPEMPYTEENLEFCINIAKELNRKVSKKHAW